MNDCKEFDTFLGFSGFVLLNQEQLEMANALYS